MLHGFIEPCPFTYLGSLLPPMPSRRASQQTSSLQLEPQIASHAQDCVCGWAGWLDTTLPLLCEGHEDQRGLQKYSTAA